jgi:hypothetical protein
VRDAARTHAKTIDKGHGRIEIRTIVATTELTTYLLLLSQMTLLQRAGR